MKRLTAFLATIILVAVGCSGDPTTGAGQIDTPAQTTAVADTTTVEDDTKPTESEAPTVIETLAPTTVAATVAKTTPATDDVEGKIVLGQPVILGDYEMTIRGFEVIKDYQGEDLLKVIYDWKNNSQETRSPFMTFSLKAFQNGVETTDSIHMSEDLDLGSGQKDVKAGGVITDVEDGIGIDDISQPLTLELSELFSFSDEVYEYEIEDLNSLAPILGSVEPNPVGNVTEPQGSDSPFELGVPVTLGKYEVTVKELSLTQDYEGKPALKIVFDWTNNGDEARAPIWSVSFTGFQDGIETESSVLFADGVDSSVTMKEVKPGATLTDVQMAIGITDLMKPLSLELSELISFGEEPYTLVIPDLNTLN